MGIFAVFFSGLGCLFTIAMACIGGWLWPYTVGFWTGYFGQLIVVPFFAGVILGLIPIIGYLTVPLAILTWVCSTFL